MIMKNGPLLEAFSNPTVPYEQKSKLLNELIARTGVLPTTANFLRILLKNQRLAELPQVNTKLAQVLDERSGVVSARVVSARPVSESIKALLDEKLAQMTGKKIRLSFDTDESLLGGIVTRIGSTIYDGSVRNQLRRLGEELAG
jgi:F-type H+-transporting ATPase subunit delta